MRLAAIVGAVLMISTWGLSQNAQSNAQSGDKGAAQSAPAGQAAAPAGKRRPMAKTQEEYAAFNAANALIRRRRRRRRTILP